MREFPERIHQQIAAAAKAAGFTDIQIEWPTEGAEGEQHLLWYDISAIDPSNTRWCFEVEPGGKKQWLTKHISESFIDKIEWAIKHGYFFMQIPAFGFNTLTITVLIKEQMMKRRQNARL